MSANQIDVNTGGTEKKAIISNQEIISRKWKFESIFKVIAGIIYGFFFGMLPATFMFNPSIDLSNPPMYEISAIVGLLITSVLSIVVIFWAFKGNIKKLHPMAYVVIHVINAVLLAAGITAVTIFYPDSSNIDRYFVLGASYAGWALIEGAIIFISLAALKRQFPLSWSKAPFSFFSLFFAGAVQLFIFLSSESSEIQQFNDQKILYIALALGCIVVSILILGFAMAFVRRFRDVLLGERTEYEIASIRDWESSRVFALIMSSTMIITYAAAIIWNSNVNITIDLSLENLPLFIEIGIDALAVLPYIIIISTIKIRNTKASNKSFIISRIFRSIDNGLLLDIFTWIIVVKSTLIQGMFMSDVNFTNQMKALSIIVTFGSVLLLHAFATIIQVNIPNLRNTAITMPTIAFSLILGVFVILFSGFLYKPEFGEGSSKNMSELLFVFMALFVLCGISVSLVIKISMIAKIFKVNWDKEQEIDKSHLAEEQSSQTNDFIGERTKEVEVDDIDLSDFKSTPKVNEGARG